MVEHAKFYAAQLRWSNSRVGLEFAPLDSDAGGDTRRLPRRQGNGLAGTPGMLLQDELERDGYPEGGGVIVIALPRRMSDSAIKDVRDRLSNIIRTEAYDDIAHLAALLAYKAMTDGD